MKRKWTIERGLRTAVLVFFLIAAFVVCCRVALGQIPIEVRNVTKHPAPLPPRAYRGKFPAAWPCTIVGYPSLPYGKEEIHLTSDDAGKTWQSTGSLCMSDFTTYRFVTSAKHAHAQQPAGSPESVAGSRPEAIKLNPEASKQYIAIENQQKEIVRQANEALQSLEREKQALLIGANVSRADLAKVECTPDAGGVVSCARKSEPPAVVGGPVPTSTSEKPKAEGSGRKAENKKPPEKQ